MKMTHFFLILENLNRKKEEHLEAVDCFAKKIIEFNEYQSSSVKSIAVKTNTSIKCTTRFMSGKCLPSCP